VRTVQPLDAEELPQLLTVTTQAFTGVSPSPEAVAARAAILEPERAVGVFEEGALIGGGRCEGLTASVPGGRLAAACLAGIAVLPTHRRQGVLNAIMRRMLDDAHERGEPLSALFASEGAIYGRYGFGVATYEAHVRVARHRSSFRASTPIAGLRLASFGEALDEMLAVIDRVTPELPGAVRRSDAWWRYVATEPPPGEVDWEVVLRAEGDGFAAYERATEGHIPSLDHGTLRVHWLLAATPAAQAALWRFCLDVDLIDQVVARTRPADEPLRHLLADPRALETSLWDGLWLRLVDVESALNGRTYPARAGGGVRLAVEDAFCPWNTGTYEVGEDGCRRVGGEADLALTAEALGACYLGGSRFTTLALAGLVEERRPGAARRADALFAAPRPPWSPFHF
jgi:predicted acetyltransferase